MGHNSIHSNFDHYYTENRKRAGTYLYDEDDEEWEED
jgi:hypothetical protein